MQCWNDTDTQYVIEHYQTETFPEMANAIGKCRNTVQLHYHRLVQAGIIEDNRLRVGHEWTAEHDQYLIDHYQNHQFHKIAKDLKFSNHTIGNKFKILEKQGLVDRRKCMKPPVWTKQEDAFLREHAGRDGVGWEQLADMLGRSPLGIKQRMQQLKIRLRDASNNTCTMEMLAKVFGTYPTSVALKGWIKSGALKARRQTINKRSAWVIYKGDIIDFITNHPDKYDYRAMPNVIDGKPNEFKQYTPKYDPLKGYLTIKQFASKLGMGRTTMDRWVRQGVIKTETLDLPGARRKERFVPVSELNRLAHYSPQNLKSMYRVSAVAMILKVKPPTIHRWIKLGKIECHKHYHIGDRKAEYYLTAQQIELLKKSIGADGCLRGLAE